MSPFFRDVYTSPRKTSFTSSCSGPSQVHSFPTTTSFITHFKERIEVHGIVGLIALVPLVIG